jgi:hypothetical protein
MINAQNEQLKLQKFVVTFFSPLHTFKQSNVHLTKKS